MGVIIPEDQLKDLYALTKENNRMLKDMRRDAMIGGIIHFVWWVVLVVVLPYLTWLYLQPYLEGIMTAYQTAQGQSAQMSDALSKLQEAGAGFDFAKLIEQAKAAVGQ
ncbi:hypothetical protein K2P56_02530 [Patescibacteria group bacterium]|nr:hypothetical protein [Patescibacteria group bacterium]